MLGFRSSAAAASADKVGGSTTRILFSHFLNFCFFFGGVGQYMERCGCT
jgi:hypothetical protein